MFVEAESVVIHGEYPARESECVSSQPAPLHARYAGRVEVGTAADGLLFVINELPFETYLEGIAEVPRRWPEAALDAQVVAARTYALSRLGSGGRSAHDLDYDLCATDACQVYRGLGISHGAWGHRWRAAVERTAGLALIHDGRPADTLYFSTSNGRTYGNDEVFGTDPVPYLRPVVERDDRESPLAEWDARLPLSDVTRFLRSAGEWDGPMITRVVRDGDRVIVQGADERATFEANDFRVAMNGRSVCLDPGDYPGRESSGYRLPQTIPSRWFGTRMDGDTLVVTGRGWGHGVGMVQWGAFGKAERGLGAADILAAYYGGLGPSPADPPATIRVLVAQGLRSVVLAPRGELRATSRRLGRDGPWLLTPGDPVRSRRSDQPPTLLEASVVRVPPKTRAGGSGRVRVEASRDVVTSVGFVGADGEPHDLTVGATSHEEGRFEQRFAVPASLEPGDYTFRVIVTDGVDEVRLAAARTTRVLRALASPTAPPTATVASPSPRARAPAGEAEDGAGVPVAAVSLGGALAALAAALLILARRRGSR